MNIEQAKQGLIFECVAGSKMYGLDTPQSDTDIRGVFTIDPKAYLSVTKPIEQTANEKQDIIYYTLHRFVTLACAGNPNILELLWCPDDCVNKMTTTWARLRAIRKTFITKKCLDSFSGYAYAQIKKAKGQNKLINNPMPEEKPTKEDFCWYIPLHYISDTTLEPDYQEKPMWSKVRMETMPFRPIKVSADTGIDIDFHQYHVSAVEHVKDLYRLYYYGNEAKGVFRGDDHLVCESIPIEDERRKFTGLLIYNKEAYEYELKRWNQYHDWKTKRNPARWKNQEQGKVDYDAKNMLHCMRLIFSAQNIIKNGEPLVRFGGDLRKFLMCIRNGEFAYDFILGQAEKNIAMIGEERKNCSLPSQPDIPMVNALLHELLV
jgi:predicted nucleotidyltransferase